jgi:hypothetical protein
MLASCSSQNVESEFPQTGNPLSIQISLIPL